MHKQILYQFIIAFIISILGLSFILISQIVDYRDGFIKLSELLLYLFIFALSWNFYYEYRVLKIKYGKILGIKSGILPHIAYKPIKGLKIEYRVSPIFGRVYFFIIGNNGISINQSMYSKRNFEVIEKYLRKNHKIINYSDMRTNDKLMKETLDIKNDLKIDDSQLPKELRIQPDIDGVQWLKVVPETTVKLKKFAVILLSISIMTTLIVFSMIELIEKLRLNPNIFYTYIFMGIGNILLLLGLIVSYMHSYTMLGRKGTKLFVKSIFGGASADIFNVIKIDNKIIIQNKSISLLENNGFNTQEFDVYIRPLLKYTKSKESLDEYTDKLYDKFIRFF